MIDLLDETRLCALSLCNDLRVTTLHGVFRFPGVPCVALADALSSQLRVVCEVRIANRTLRDIHSAGSSQSYDCSTMLRFESD